MIVIFNMESLALSRFDMKKIKPTNVCVFVASRNSGKCLAKGTEVMMYNCSIKKIENIKTGEFVMGDDSTKRKVMGTTSGIDEMFEIENREGDKYTINSHHVLSLKSIEDNLYIDIPLKEYLSLSELRRKNLLGYKVQIHSNYSIKGENIHSPIKVSAKGRGEYYGFELDGNHRFVLGNRVVTHNSFLIRDLMYHHQNIPAGMVISKTDKLTHYYEKFIPPILIHEEYSPQILDKLFDRQKKALKEEWPNPHAFLIFDDTISDANVWKRDTRIKEIFFNGRHYKILFLLTMQDPKAITPGLRSNIDFSFILRTPNQATRRSLYENYCGMFPSYEIFEKVLDSCTEDYGCLVIDNTSRSNKLEDQVFFYKASDHEPFKICSNAYWQKKKQVILNDNATSSSSTLRNSKKFTIIKKN